MEKLYPFMLFGLLLPCTQLTAQGKQVPVEVVVDKLSYSHIRGFLERTTEAVYKFYRNEIGPQNYIADKGCLLLVSKEADKTQSLADDPQLSPYRTMRPYMLNTDDSIISIKMEAFKHQKGEPCTFNKSDRHYSTAGVEVKMNELDPGVFSTPYRLAGKDGKLAAEIRVRYGLPLPAPVRHKDNMAINDINKVVELTSFLGLGNKKNLNYQWEYQLEGNNEWKVLGKTISESIVFYPLRDVLKTPIKTTQLIKFRMKAVSKEISGDYVYYETKFTPEAPELTSINPTITASCSGAPTGVINMGEVKGVVDKLAYYVVKGKTVKEQEMPDLISAVRKVKWGTITSGMPLKVEGLAPDDYTLVVHNAGMEVGNMFVTHGFSITQFPALTIKSSEVKEASCSSTPDGQILVETEGGNPSRFTYLISPAAGKQQTMGRMVVFSDLPPGRYDVVIKDACSQLASKDIEVPGKTAQLHGQLSIKTEAINEFANGSVNIALESGSGKYKYSVWNNNAVVIEKDANAGRFVIDRLPKGTFQLKVLDVNAPKCPGWDTLFTMTAKVIVSDSTVSIKDSTSKNQPVSQKLPVQDNPGKPYSSLLLNSSSIFLNRWYGLYVLHSGSSINSIR